MDPRPAPVAGSGPARLRHGRQRRSGRGLGRRRGRRGHPADRRGRPRDHGEVQGPGRERDRAVPGAQQVGELTAMRAFAIDEFGQPGSLRDLPVPEPGEGQVRILVAAAGLNPFDNAVVQGYLKDRMEHRFPLVPGMDASGTVEAVGEGIEAWRVGDEVFGSVGKMYLGEGTLAEFAAMSAGTVARKPASVDHRAAAAIPVAGVTALLMADALHLSEGDVVVAIGASGGVGSYFVQLAS